MVRIRTFVRRVKTSDLTGSLYSAETRHGNIKNNQVGDNLLAIPEVPDIMDLAYHFYAGIS